MSEKIGVGIVTYQRQEFFRNLFVSIPACDELVVVNDGASYPAEAYSGRKAEIIQHKKNKGVGKSKNDAMRYLLEKGCKHIFILEDDILIKDPSVFEKYISISKKTGIQHFNYAYHGPLNKNKDGSPKTRGLATYDGEPLVILNEHIPGAFSYFTREILEQTGLIDEWYYNAWEHVDLTTRITKLSAHTPFWWFADIFGSDLLIGDQDQDLSKSSIRKNNFSFMLYFRIFSRYYRLKHGYIPYKTPDSTPEEVERQLTGIFTKYCSGKPIPKIKISTSN